MKNNDKPRVKLYVRTLGLMSLPLWLPFGREMVFQKMHELIELIRQDTLQIIIWVIVVQLITEGLERMKIRNRFFTTPSAARSTADTTGGEDVLIWMMSQKYVGGLTLGLFAVTAPLFAWYEEWLFRGLPLQLFSGLPPIPKFALAFLVSTLAFALMHIGSKANAKGLLISAVFGTVMLAIVATKGVQWAAAMHLVYNWVSIACVFERRCRPLFIDNYELRLARAGRSL